MQLKQEIEESSSDNEEQMDDITADDSISRGSSATLLSVLDDKNRAIEVLQRQLQNQKLQLGYYIRNALKPSKIMQLSKTCEPDTVDSNISLTLALSNFCKQTGMKSRLMSLYERMTGIEEPIQKIIARQEWLLKEMVEKFVENTFSGSFQICGTQSLLSQLFFNKQHVDMLNEIFHATVSLQSELERYRLCCNKLIAIEDERNALVEQVYSLPVEERARCNYILLIQMEKKLLEKEMNNIRYEQNQLQTKLRQLKLIEKGLREAQINGDFGDDSFGTQLMEMLESVRADAFALLNISKSQKCRYHNELTKLTAQNKTLEQKVKNLQRVVNEEIQIKVNPYKDVKETALKVEICEKDKLIEELQLELKTKTDENTSLVHSIDKLRNEIDELETAHRANLEDAESLQTERDNYKLQVEDLEAIRGAYSQLLEHHPKIEAELTAKEKQLEELEDQYESVLSETSRLKKANILQESHIKYLLKVIEKLADCKDSEKIIRAEIGSQYNVGDCKIVCQEPISNLEKQRITNCFTKAHDNQDALNKCKISNTNFIGNTNHELDNRNSCAAETGDSLHCLQKHFPLLSKTTFEVQRTDYKGKVESMKAILESTSSVQGIIHLENANKLSLEVQCKKTKSIDQNKVPGDVDDENELMKDCSRETIPNICTPYQYYESYEMKECFKNCGDETNFLELRKEEQYKVMDVSKETDVIEYKSAPHCEDEFGSCWEDSSSSSEVSPRSATSEVLQDPEFLVIPKGNENNDETDENTEKQEQAFNQLICIHKSLKLITNTLDTVLKKPGGKTSVMNTLHEMYKSLFSKQND